VSRFVVGSLGLRQTDYSCVEASITSCEALRAAGFSTRQVDVSCEDLPFPPASFDVVIASEVLEHLVNPDVLLDGVKRVLAPGGVLICTTPNMAAWFNRILIVLGVQPIFTETGSEWVYGRAPFLPPSRPVGHFHIFTGPALRELLRAHGLEPVRQVGLPSDEVVLRSRALGGLDRLFAHINSLAADMVIAARAVEPRGNREE